MSADLAPAIAPTQSVNRLFGAMARAIAPRQRLTVSAWADKERFLSSKGSAFPGQWRTSRNPPIREPMDCMSEHSPVREIVLIGPIQLLKTEAILNPLGYTMRMAPCPIMALLPDDISRDKWINQKLNPMLDESPQLRRVLTSTNSRDTANQRYFKDYEGGQLFIEHGKTLTRLAMNSIKVMLVDEFDKFAAQLTGGEDPIEVVRGRLSSFPNTYKAMFTGSPSIQGLSRLERLWDLSDQRKYHVPCPECGEFQPLEWKGLHWSPDGSTVYYVCCECGACIDEHHKTDMIAAGRWVPANPEAKHRGYRINCLYYQFGLGPRWADLVKMWRDAQNDPAALQVFVTERLAEAWRDKKMRKVNASALADRTEQYALRTAPMRVLEITVGVDTQDDRLAVHFVGWDRVMGAWIIDYVELPGDPNDEKVWIDLVDLVNRPIMHESGKLMRVNATCIDAGGHRTHAVYNFVRQRKLRRCLPIFGANRNNAPVLSKGTLVDVNWKNKLEKNGVKIHHVGGIDIKFKLYSRISSDGEKSPEDRMLHLSFELDDDYCKGLTSEIWDPKKNTFVKRTGVRNEPLDTWVYAYAAAHHPELRLHRRSKADWDAAEKRLSATPATGTIPHETTAPIEQDKPVATTGRRLGKHGRRRTNFTTSY